MSDIAFVGIFGAGLWGKDRLAAASSLGVARDGKGASTILLAGFGLGADVILCGADCADVKYATLA